MVEAHDQHVVEASKRRSARHAVSSQDFRRSREGRCANAAPQEDKSSSVGAICRPRVSKVLRGKSVGRPN